MLSGAMENARTKLVAAFAQITSHRALTMAFARVAKAGGGAGGDGVSLIDFARDTRGEIGRLVCELQNGRYRPGRFRRYSIAKDSGGRRQLAVPCIRDRIVQSAVAAALNGALDGKMSKASFAYRKGLSVEHAGALVMFWQLRGFCWAVDGDIEKFFDRVPHKGVGAMLRGFGVCPRTVRLILLWLGHYARGGCGLPQGSPLSPVLANLYLAPFDAAMETKKVKLVRYADDFLLLTRKKKEAVAARKKAEQVLAGLGLRLNRQKSRLVRLEDGLDFLGLKVDGKGVRKG